ncbi:g1588 [Coccomyxa elongata]
MHLQRASSDAIEKSFHDSLKNGDSSFLLDTDELKLEDIIRLRTGTSEGEAAALGSSAIQESLLTLETGGLPEDEWLVASPSEVPEEKPRGFVVPGEKYRNPRDAILASAPPEGVNIQAASQPIAENRKRSISSPEPSGSPPILQPPRGRKGTNAALNQQEKVSKPGTTSAPESFTPSPPRLTINPAIDHLGDSKIPRSPLARSTEALLASRIAGSAGLSPSRLPSPGAIPQSPKRPLTPRSSPLNKGSPMGESRIPKPRGGAQAATPETRKQRYAPRPTPERSFPSGSSAGGRSSSSRPRSAKPKPKLADLEKGWVGNEVAIDDNSEDVPFDGGEALRLAEELSAQSDTKAGMSEDVELGSAKTGVAGTSATVAADSSSRFVDASTQVTPKVGGSAAAIDGTALPDAPADKTKACSCCAIM